MPSQIVDRSSVVNAAKADVWARVITPEGINNEVRPWMTMTMPRGAADFTVDTVPIGEPLGKAWLRLFGVIPFDYDALTIAELTPGTGFHEKSTMLSMRRWEHQRTLTAVSAGSTEVHDRLTFEARVPLIGPILRRIVAALFAHRHRRLARYFG
jgi:hypothetical protein